FIFRLYPKSQKWGYNFVIYRCRHLYYNKSQPPTGVAALRAATRLLGLCPNKTGDSYKIQTQLGF
ncbi:MAG: hypothetical protein ACK6C7_19290, partial [Pseudanabaena sp.]